MKLNKNQQQWGEKLAKKRNLPVLTQPELMPAKGGYPTASWAGTLCGTGFLMWISLNPVGSWCSVLSWIFQLQSLSCLWPAEPNPPCPGESGWFAAPSCSAGSALSLETLSLLSKPVGSGECSWWSTWRRWVLSSWNAKPDSAVTFLCTERALLFLKRALR